MALRPTPTVRDRLSQQPRPNPDISLAISPLSGKTWAISLPPYHPRHSSFSDRDLTPTILLHPCLWQVPRTTLLTHITPGAMCKAMASLRKQQLRCIPHAIACQPLLHLVYWNLAQMPCQPQQLQHPL